MTVSVHNLIKERKYPFIACLFILIVFITFFIFLTTNASQPPPPRPLYRVRQPSSHPSVTKLIPKTTSLPLQETVSNNNSTDIVNNSGLESLDDGGEGLGYEWKVCSSSQGVDYIPCLDNRKAIKSLRSRRHMEHRERFCPKPSPRCLISLPHGYKVPVPWPKSRDMIWFDNVPHLKLVEYKKEQNWVKRSGKYLLFPGGGTQFKEGVNHYIQYIEKNLPKIGCGIYHDWCEAFSTYPRTYDLIHANGLFTLYKDKCDFEDILLEMDRILRPEGAVILRDEVDVLMNVKNIAGAMRWDTKLMDHEDGPLIPEKILVAVKQYWVVGSNSTSTR